LGTSTIDALPLDGEGITIRALRTKTTQYVPDTRDDSSYVSSRAENSNESLSELDVPVVVNNEAVAIINVEDHNVDSFSDDEIQMIEILGTHIGSAIQRIEYAKQMASIREAHLLELVGGIDKICERVQKDLRGPIHSIRSTSFLMRHNPELVGELIDNLDNSLELIENTLGEMKEITNPTEPEKKLTDIYTLLNHAIELSQVPNNIKLVKDYTEGFMAISLDEEKIKRVFYNILRNAIEASKPGSTITVSIRVENSMIVFGVKDEGAGIPESIMPNLYTPFFSTKPQSLGLGLSFCRLAVESNGGSINITSREGEGTLVEIRLPL
jgi:signal transduction histidine kinase